MTSRRWILFLLAVTFQVISATSCTKEQPSPTPSSSEPTPAQRLTEKPTRVPVTNVPATATATAVPPTPAATVPPSGRALTDVKFALDVDQTGQLVFPADEFVHGVTRVYVRFAYQGMEGATAIETRWYLNENPVSGSTLPWDGGETGAYLMWIEDPNGLGRGQWRWELLADGASLGGAAFTIGGAPRYVNESWGISFDPPASWKQETETTGFVTFSSPDRRRAIALHFTPGIGELSEIVAADLTLFREEHPDAEAVVTEEVTMNGERALLQQVRYTDDESSEHILFIVSALHAGAVHSLWVLGPAEEAAALNELLAATLFSIRFSTAD